MLAHLFFKTIRLCISIYLDIGLVPSNSNILFFILKVASVIWPLYYGLLERLSLMLV